MAVLRKATEELARESFLSEMSRGSYFGLITGELRQFPDHHECQRRDNVALVEPALLEEYQKRAENTESGKVLASIGDAGSKTMGLKEKGKGTSREALLLYDREFCSVVPQRETSV